VLRPAVYDFYVSIIPEINVLSYNDVTIDTEIKKAGTITLENIEPEPESV
jgi:flagellar biosynthesis component FlhA